MRRAIGYLHTLRQYAATPKGRHDILDTLYVGGTFVLLVALVLVILCVVR